jgi:hypothetical protein
VIYRRRNVVDGKWMCGNQLHEMVPENQGRVPGRAGVHCRECRVLRQRRKRRRRAEDRPALDVSVVYCSECRDVVTSHGCKSRALCSKHYARWRKATARVNLTKPVVVVPLPALVGAACSGWSEPLWDADVAGENLLQRNLRLERAVGVCWRCPIKRACGEARRGAAGVWGGCLFAEPQ